MKTLHILAPDINGGVKNFCHDFSLRLKGHFLPKTHYYKVDFGRFELNGLKIGGLSRSQDQARHIWETIDLGPSDIVLCNDGRELIWVGASGISNPVIYVMHGDCQSYYDAIELNGHLCNLIVCINPGIQNKLKATVIAEKLFYLQQIFTPSKKNVDELITLKAKNLRPRIAFVGRANNAKGFDILINAIGMNPQFDFEIFLNGDASAPVVLSKLANIRVILNARHSEVINALEKADHLFFPSRKEGLPLSILEALSCGCSVSCLSLIGFEMAFKGCDGVMVNHSERELYNTLKQKATLGNVRSNCDQSREWEIQSQMSVNRLSELMGGFGLTERTRVRYSMVDRLPSPLARWFNYFRTIQIS